MVSIELEPDDVITLLAMMNQLSFTGKAGAVQFLRIFHAFENALPKPDPTVDDE